MIFDEVLEQYMQLSLQNKQFKNNIQNLAANIKTSPNINLNNNNTNINIYPNHLDSQPKQYKTIFKVEHINTKEFLDKLEFDARRYNSNFDSQTGAVLL